MSASRSLSGRVTTPKEIELSVNEEETKSSSSSASSSSSTTTTAQQHLDHNKQSYNFWKDSLINLGYEHGHHSFLDPTVTPEGKATAKHKQSLRLRKSSSMNLRRSSFTAQKASILFHSGGTYDDNLLFQFFDLTDDRLFRLFQVWDQDGDGAIGIDEFLQGLKSQNLNIIGANKIEATKEYIAGLFGVTHSAQLNITFRMFSTFFHRTKMALLFYEPLRRKVYLKIKGHDIFMHYPTESRLIHPTSSFSSSSLQPPVYIPTAEILIVDYNKEKVKLGCSNPNSNDVPKPFTLENEDAKGYFFGSRDPGFTMRWVSVMKPDPISVITVAVKYRLHPLALQDILQLNLQRPKVDKYDVHYFVVFPALRLTADAYDMIEDNSDDPTSTKWNINNPNLCELWDRKKKNGTLALVEMQNYCLCVAGPNHQHPEFSYDTVISVEAGYKPIIPLRSGENIRKKQTTFVQKYEAEENGNGNDSQSSRSSTKRTKQQQQQQQRRRNQRNRSNDFLQRRTMTYDGGTHFEGETTDSVGAFRHDLFRLLGTDFSRLRMQRSIFMMYQIIDTSVAKIGPILEMYKKRLDWYTFQIRKQRWKFGDRIRGLLDTKRELELIKEYVRPCINVIRHIINDPDLAEDDDGSSGDGGGKSNTNGGGDRLLKKIEIKQYFEDIDDTLNLYTESIEHMAGLCDSYNSEFTGYGDKRMNDILFVLTIVTTLFVPAQFFTGVFGMNFVKKDGSPNMPLLNWQYGYFFFWCLSLGLTFLTFLVLFINGWMPCAECNRCADNFDDEED